MRAAGCIRTGICWLLTLALLLPARPATAAPSDGSTLAGDRGGVPAGGGNEAPSADPFTGAASYAVPIALAPGTGGLTPELALRYSSALRADSWVGYGWTLGLSSISRSLTRGVPAYDDAVDVFELDGQRLVPSASEPRRYHTRRESFLRIVHEADDSWTVTRKDGMRLRFGLAEDARVRSSGGATFQWLLSEQEDARGNAFVVRYDRRDAGTAYPSELRYTLRRSAAGILASLGGDAARDRVVRFVLEPRDDAPVSYSAGFPRRLGHRLDRVDVQLDGALLRRYDLRYAASPDSFRTLLTQLALYGTDAEAPSPTPPRVTTLSYRSNVATNRTGWASTSWSWPGGLSLVRSDRRDGGVRLADMDGDGRPDLIKAYAVQHGQDFDASSDSGVYLNLGTGFSTTKSPAFTLPVFTGQGGNRLSLAFAWEFASNVVWGNGMTPIELTGDGRADFVGAIGAMQPYPSLGALFQSYQGSWCRSDPARPGGFACLGLSELYGDGALYTGKQGLVLSGLQLQLTFFGGNARFGDLDGDGLPDVAVRGRELVFDDRLGSECLFATTYSYAVYNRGGLLFERAPLDAASAPNPGCQAHRSLISRDFQPCSLAADPSCAVKLFQNVTQLGGDELFGWLFEAHPEYGNLLIDLNGDGLADVASATQHAGALVRAAWLNDGAHGFTSADAFSPPLALYDVSEVTPYSVGTSRDLGVRLADVNGDGRVDVVQSLPSSLRATWLNDGDTEEASSPSPWVASDAWKIPTTSGLEFVNAQGQDTGVRLEDLDGDGMTDIVRSIGSTRQVYLNRGELPDLLTQVTTPLGGTTFFEYTPSTELDHSGGDGVPDLPQVLQLVTAVTVDDADPGTPVSRSTQSYEGGLYDAVERELRGFRKVTTTSPDGRSVITFLHQDVARAGLVERVERRDAAGALWQAVESSYTPDADGLAPFTSLPASQTALEYDGQASPRRSRTAFVYDGGGPLVYGNLTARVEYGEVDASGADLVAADTRTSEIEYALNPALHLVDRVKRRVLRAGLPGSGSVLRDTRLFYDGDTSGSAAPTRGLLTRQIAILSRSGEPDPTTTFAYDVYGNPTAVADPGFNAGQGGGVTRFEYDAVYHTFRTAVVNALGHRQEIRYTTPAGCTPHPAGSGIPQEERGPNLLAGEGGLRRCLDVFGRVVLERAPLDLADTTWSYQDTPGAASVTRSDRATLAGGRRSQTSLLDGLGRTIETRTSGPQGRAIVVTRSYDPSGRLAAESAPHFSGEASLTTSYLYDALDRARQITLPGTGRTTRFSYLRGLTTRTDANDNVTRQQFDVFGRVVRVEEVNGAQTYVTSYFHDVVDQLIQVQDMRGNVTQVAYDKLGRKRALLDPDTGWSLYGYDANGDLSTRSDPSGLVTWSYDALGRARTRTLGNTLEASWSYDSAIRGKGLLATRTDGSGSYRAAGYDPLGRLVADAQTTGGAGLAFFTSYDPLGQVASRSFPTGRTLEWSRDASGYLTAVGSDGEPPFAAAIEWDARGRLAKWVGGNGVVSTSSSVATTGRLDTLDVRSGSTILEQLRYSFDAGDRVTAIDDRRPGALPDRSFAYDGLDRLIQATGPYRADLLSTTLRYAYDELGNLLCLDATSLAGCAGGTALTYPSVAGASRPHAPLSVNGETASHDLTGNLTNLGPRSYAYDLLGRLSSATEGAKLLASFAYDAGGRRAQATDRSGARTIVRELLRGDFEWDRTRGLARVHVTLAGAVIATQVEPFALGGIALAPPAAPLGRSLALRFAAAPGALAALLLALQLALLRRRGAPIGRSALAGGAALLVYLDLVSPALALPDGDLNADARLDAADALLAQRISSGALTPTPAQIERGDVAPLDATPEASVPRIHAGDVLLLLRALRGDDVDGDGLDPDAELALGASPFRADSDRDGLSDSFEAAFGTQPAQADSDSDGLSDGVELANGTDPTSADTDADGIVDAADPQPLAGVVYRHADHLGSSVLVTKADGSLLERAVYRPYGAIVPATSGGSTRAPEFGFTGQRFEAALAIYDYGARFYDPRLGRFLQPDSVVPGAERPQALNRYAYAFGNPLAYTDPSGHWPDWGGLWAGATRFFDDYVVSPISNFGGGFAEAFSGVWNARGVPRASEIGFSRSAGQAVGGLFATPFALLQGNPFPDPQYRLGGDPSQAVSLETARGSVSQGIATHGVLNDPQSVAGLADRRLKDGGVVLFNPSGGVLNDLLESAVQLVLPGATDLDRALSALIPSEGRVPFAFGSSQGTLTVRNGLFLAGLSGRRGVVDEARFTGSPSNAALSFVMASAIGGATLRNEVTARDPVAALGQPWFTPIALGALAIGNVIHPDESYYRRYGDF